MGCVRRQNPALDWFIYRRPVAPQIRFQIDEFSQYLYESTEEFHIRVPRGFDSPPSTPEGTPVPVDLSGTIKCTGSLLSVSSGESRMDDASS